MIIRFQMSLVMVELDRYNWIDLSLNKENAILRFVCTLSSTNISRSAPQLVTYKRKISNEFDYGSHRTRINGVIFP